MLSVVWRNLNVFFFRSKRRKHAVDVNTIMKLLSELSDTATFSSLSGDKSVEMLEDFVKKLSEILSTSRTQHVQMFADVSTLNHILQVSFILCIFSLSYRCV